MVMMFSLRGQTAHSLGQVATRLTASGLTAIALLCLPSPTPAQTNLPPATPAATPLPKIPGGLRSFSDWCGLRHLLPYSSQLTVDLMLKQSQVQNCALAQKRLLSVTRLNLSGPVSDPRPLLTLPQLQRLSLKDHALEDLTPLTQLKNLRVLDLSGRSTMDHGLLPSGPAELGKAHPPKSEKLAQLPAWIPQDFMRPRPSNRLSDLRPLAYMPQLQELYLGGNAIADIRPLAYLPNLRILSLHSTPLRNLETLATLPQLEDLDLHSLASRDFGPIATLVKLKRLNLANTQLKDLRLLQNLVNLRELDLGSNQITDLRELSRLSQLERLSLDHNQVRDLSPLAAMTGLEVLYLRNNQIRDFRIVANFKRLEQLWAWDNPTELAVCPHSDPLVAGEVCRYQVR